MRVASHLTDSSLLKENT